MSVGNLFADADPPDTGERFSPLYSAPGVTIERIVSSLRPDDAEYDQAHDEWVVLLRGSAELEVEGARQVLAAGDYLHLPARTKHRVLATSHGALWLAVHLTFTASSAQPGT
ncbi:MAG: cupin domain-containing protein [Myxococcales bacterium]|nr:cupin domain-containing protein [Myxococcales bacterium]MCB9627908.1 cupin domain-containing protein [Sandaracinaceae bacterium]